MIRLEMEAKRAALADKLERLESKIVGTVEDAREAVAETVQTVKSGVQDSVHAVRDSVETSVHAVQDSFDLPRQVDRHPWAMFGGAVAVGFAAGYLLNRSDTSATSTAPRPAFAPAARSGYSWPQQSETRSPQAQEPRGESWLDHAAHLLGPEFQKVKSLALGALMGVVREVIAQPLPDQMRPKVKDIVDDLTTKLGGEPVSSDAVESLVPRRRDDHHNGHHGAAQPVGPSEDERRDFGL